MEQFQFITIDIRCTNVAVFTGYSGIDPEIYSGIDREVYPRPRTYSFSASLSF